VPFNKIEIYLKNIYILALEMASLGNQHCATANCIDTLSFPKNYIFFCAKMRRSQPEMKMQMMYRVYGCP